MEVENNSVLDDQNKEEIVSNSSTTKKTHETDLTSAEIETLKNAIKLFLNGGKITVQYLQLKLQIGYGRAAWILDQLEKRGYISLSEDSKDRKITITPEQYKKDFNEDLDD